VFQSRRRAKQQLDVIALEPQLFGHQLGFVHGLAGAKRASFMPDIPTIAEAGVPGATMDNMSWYGVFGPAKLPAKITAKLNTEFAAALKVPQVVERIEGLRLTPAGDTPKEFAAFMEAELKRFAEMIKLAGYQPE